MSCSILGCGIELARGTEKLVAVRALGGGSSGGSGVAVSGENARRRLTSPGDGDLKRSGFGADGSDGDDEVSPWLGDADLKLEKLALYLATSRSKRCKARRSFARLVVHSMGKPGISAEPCLVPLTSGLAAVGRSRLATTKLRSLRIDSVSSSTNGRFSSR